jgi:hypothetical protein
MRAVKSAYNRDNRVALVSRPYAPKHRNHDVLRWPGFCYGLPA